MEIIDNAFELKDYAQTTSVEGSDWKQTVVIWAAKAVYWRHRRYFSESIALTGDDDESIREAIQGMVEYVKSHKLDDLMSSVIGWMTGSMIDVIVLVALQDLRATDIDLQRKIPVFVFQTGSTYTLTRDGAPFILRDTGTALPAKELPHNKTKGDTNEE